MAWKPNLVVQTNSTTCGQACAAMLLGISIEEAISRIGHDGITSDKEMLRVLGLGDGRFIGGKPPDGVVALQKHQQPHGAREHWTVSWLGETLDPARIGKKLWPAAKYVEVK